MQQVITVKCCVVLVEVNSLDSTAPAKTSMQVTWGLSIAFWTRVMWHLSSTQQYVRHYRPRRNTRKILQGIFDVNMQFFISTETFYLYVNIFIACLVLIGDLSTNTVYYGNNV